MYMPSLIIRAGDEAIFSPNMAQVWPEAHGNPWGFHGFWVARCVEAHKSREGHKAASREARQYGPALCVGLPTTLALLKSFCQISIWNAIKGIFPGYPATTMA
jgi:hypothetical protein